MLAALILKEVRVLLRNLHALAVLFLMPTLFLVLMAAAMANINLERQPTLDVELQAADDADSRFFAAALQAQLGGGQLSLAAGAPGERPRVALPEDFSDSLLKNGATPLRLILPARTDATTRQQLRGALQVALAQTRLMAYLQDTGDLDESLPLERQLALVAARTASQLDEQELLASGEPARKASATQHNVPAWLIFGMFFVMLPMANAFQREQANGTLLRLRCMGLGLGHLTLGKLPAYFAVNLLQFALMLAVGVWVLPLLGLPALSLPGSPLAYLLLALCLSMAACSLGLAIAGLARSTEQALLLSGGLNIILAAIGGIMVPKSVMPESMRLLAEVSPMSWGLDAFLTLLVGQGGLADIAPLCLRLLLFALTAACLGLFLFHRRLRETQWTTQY